MSSTQVDQSRNRGGRRWSAAVAAGVAGLVVLWPLAPGAGADEAGCVDAPSGRFIDVDGAHAPGIDCVSWWGIAQGTGDHRYDPDRSVTRAQMASFVARWVERTGGELPADPPAGFDDVADGTHALAISQLAELGVVSGITADRYGPELRVTRAQMASFLARGWEARTGQELPDVDGGFRDVDGGVHADNIQRIAEAGISQGVGDDRYAPDADVTRGQMATFLSRSTENLVAEGYAPYPPPDPVELPEPDPELGLSWERVPHDPDAFGGEGDQRINAVIEAGPGLVGVGYHSDGVEELRDAGVWLSEDGVSWERLRDQPNLSAPDSLAIDDVVAGEDRLVAVGSDTVEGRQRAAVWTSEDGTEWDRVPNDEAVFDGLLMRQVFRAGPGFVALGIGSDQKFRVWTSPDGRDWALEPFDEGTFGASRGLLPYDVVAADSGFVAVGTYRDENGDSSAGVLTSDDGVNWEHVASAADDLDTRSLRHVVANDSGLVVLSQAHENIVAVSEDGTDWEQIDGDDLPVSVRAATVTADGRFVAVGSAATFLTAWTSTDGRDWQQRAFPPGDDRALTATAVSTRGIGLVAVGYGGVRSGTGRDLAAWTSP